jgi:FxsC-like protein
MPVPAARLPAAPAAPPGGPKHVEFIVVAAPASDLEAVRRAVNAYGATFDDWCPYRPVQDDRVGLLVQGIAYQEKLTSGVLPVAQNIVAHVNSAKARNTLVILVVDIWSLQLPTYNEYMNLFDGVRLINAGALVVWNNADTETLGEKQRLIQGLVGAFPNLTTTGDPLAFHDQLGSAEELTEKLRATLHELRRRITLHGNPVRKAEGDATIAKPLLAGPGTV